MDELLKEIERWSAWVLDSIRNCPYVVDRRAIDSQKSSSNKSVLPNNQVPEADSLHDRTGKVRNG